MSNHKSISESININASPERIWQVLTDRNEMQNWMGEEDLDLNVNTNWEEGTPIEITGFHHERFVNNGIILKSNRPYELSYTHRSSISNLPDVPASYCIFEFLIQPLESTTKLQLSIHQFPTETIFLHLQLYWKSTLKIIKEQAEK